MTAYGPPYMGYFFMPFVISGVATYSAIGPIQGFFETWMISLLRS